VLLRPALPAIRLPLLPLAVGLAAADAIRSVSGLAAELRWPNDLLLSTPRTKTCPRGPRSGARKVCGILVEAKSKGSAVAFAVAGIGINVHQRGFAPGLTTPATSLEMEAGQPVSRQALLVSLLKSLERETLGLLDPAAGETIPARVERASTWVRGRRVAVHGPQACTGVTDGLDEHGFLLVRTADGLVTVQTGGIRDAEMS
jgi:BirA family biotin operon repressor/biotin-[acetyl-CoA-carboxylase] ligase